MIKHILKIPMDKITDDIKVRYKDHVIHIHTRIRNIFETPCEFCNTVADICMGDTHNSEKKLHLNLYFKKNNKLILMCSFENNSRCACAPCLKLYIERKTSPTVSDFLKIIERKRQSIKVLTKKANTDVVKTLNEQIKDIEFKISKWREFETNQKLNIT